MNIVSTVTQAGSFDAFEYVHYLRGRWIFLAAAIGIALVGSLSVSLLLGKRYTAVASIVIDTPAGEDPRMATAVSPMYLESLKTYEEFASSDSLFARAIERFHLREEGLSQSPESLKRSVLAVSKLRDTRILEIRATRPDPKQAQALAQFIAEATVKMSRENSAASDQEAVEQAQRQFDGAQANFAATQGEWARYTTGAPIEGLDKELDAGTDLTGKIREQWMNANAEIAEYETRQNATDPKELAFVKQELAGARARAAELAKQNAELDRETAARTKVLAGRRAKRDVLQAQVEAGQAAVDAAASRLRDARALAGLHGERLRVVDPGVVPQTPSSPNIPLNVLAALLIALVMSIVYLTIAFNYQLRRAVDFEPRFTVASRGDR